MIAINDGKSVSAIQGNNGNITMEKLAPPLDWSAMKESEHFVQFYETDEFLLNSVSSFIGTGLGAGGAGIVIATKAHGESIEERLQAFRVDVPAASASGQYIRLDAADTLSKLMVDGMLEPRAFAEVIRPIVAGSADRWRRVRVFGEMVSLLWAEGNYDAAIRLEQRWNELHESHPFLLLCAYPIDGFDGKAFTAPLGNVCAEHSRVIPTESYLALANPKDRLRAVVLLQQKARALQAEIAERTQAEERLRVSENRYRRLFEAAGDGILIVDPETGRITDANPFMTELLGFTYEELLDQELWEIGLFKDREAALEVLRQLPEKRFIQQDHLSVQTKNGQWREAEFISHLYDANGHQVIQCNLRDVTEHRHAEETSYHLAAIVESSDDVIISKSLDGIILSWNKGAERIFGYSSEEAIGKPIYILIPPDRIDEEPDILARLKRGERIDHYETVRVAKDGRAINVSVTVSPIRDGTGKIIGASKIARDITERKQAEEQLREQAEVIETINRIGQILSAELNLQNVVQAVTDAATHLIGARVGSFFYKVADQRDDSDPLYTLSGSSREAFSKFPLPRNADLFGPTFRGGGIIRIPDVNEDPRYGRNSPYYGLPTGNLPVTSYLAVPVISQSGEALGGLFFGHPDKGVFTERHERIVEGLAAQAAIAMDNARLYELSQSERAKAECANRAKDDFLATISHELRTPLNAIIGWSHMLRSGRLDEANVTRAVETIERNAKAQAQLIEDILDVSRVVSGKLRLNVALVDMASVINAAVDSVQLAADSKGIKVAIVMDSSARHTYGDSNRLQQVVWNLLSNAIKFTSSGGRVEVRLECVDSDVQIKVSDTGQGISADFLPLVFDRFRQADAGSTRRHGGLGLGLAIVQQLVELHGGSVRAESAGEGCGATFTIRFPLARAHERGKRPGRAAETLWQNEDNNAYAEPLPSVDGLRLLLVDDDPDTLQLLTVTLSELGAKIQAASSAPEALEFLQWYKPDVMVCDLAMPDEDGYSLIGKIRALEEGGVNQTPAVALTAYVRVEARARALSAGFNMFVPKPVQLNELVSAIANLAAPRATKAARV